MALPATNPVATVKLNVATLLGFAVNEIADEVKNAPAVAFNALKCVPADEPIVGVVRMITGKSNILPDEAVAENACKTQILFPSAKFSLK